MCARDLFGWRDEADAAAQVAAAEAARAEAERKARVAPHGQVQTRQARLIAATHEALKAELALSRVKGGARL